MKKCDFSNYKVGDRVWNVIDGWQEVVEIFEGSKYPIKTVSASYTIDGRYIEIDEFPTIYHNEFKIPDEAFVRPLTLDTKVLVWRTKYKEDKFKRYFKEFDSLGNIVCFNNGCDSWSTNGATNTWDNYEVVSNEAL